MWPASPCVRTRASKRAMPAARRAGSTTDSKSRVAPVSRSHACSRVRRSCAPPVPRSNTVNWAGGSSHPGGRLRYAPGSDAAHGTTANSAEVAPQLALLNTTATQLLNGAAMMASIASARMAKARGTATMLVGIEASGTRWKYPAVSPRLPNHEASETESVAASARPSEDCNFCAAV